MSYSERAYFDREPCQHVAAWQDHTWREARRKRAVEALQRRHR